MDAVTPKSTHDTLDTHSHVVRPADMEWKKTRFPGCEVKGLLLDKETGLVTALMRFAPGATLPDHEHVKIEQTYVLEGKLCDKEGPAKGLTVGPGEFVWREAGSRHVAWTPEGGLMLAMFQVPNKFYRKGRPRHRSFRRRLGRSLGAYLQGVSMLRKSILAGAIIALLTGAASAQMPMPGHDSRKRAKTANPGRACKAKGHR